MAKCLWLCSLCVVIPAVLVGSLPYLVALVPFANFPVPKSGGCVLVTGASSGIGRAAVLAILAEGYEVYAGVRRPADGETLLDLVPDGARKPFLKPLILDVAKEEEIRAALQTLQGSCDGRFVGLVNNAGVSTKSPMETVSLDKFREVFEINVFGLVSLTQKLIPLLRETQGRIINIGSASGTLTTPLSGTYSASKYALEAVSDALRLELRPWNISVSMVNPAYVLTDIRKKAVSQLQVGNTEADAEYYPDLFKRALDKEPKLLTIAAPCCEVTDNDILHALTSPVPRVRYYPGNVAPNVQLKYIRWILPLLSVSPEIERLADMVKQRF